MTAATLIELSYHTDGPNNRRRILDTIAASPGVTALGDHPETDAMVVTVTDPAQFAGLADFYPLDVEPPDDTIVDVAIEWLAYLIRRTSPNAGAAYIAGARLVELDGEPVDAVTDSPF